MRFGSGGQFLLAATPTRERGTARSGKPLACEPAEAGISLDLPSQPKWAPPVIRGASRALKNANGLVGLLCLPC